MMQDAKPVIGQGQRPARRQVSPWITACCDARNAASVAVLERLRMRREGHLRQSTWAKGDWTDDLLYALLQDEWQASRGSNEPDL